MKNLNATQKEAIDTFVDKICKEYENTMLHFSFENTVYQKYVKILEYINIAKKASLIILGVDAILLILINLKRMYKFISLIGLSLNISGLFINAKIKIETITILNNSISEIVRNVLNEILSTVMKNGWILLIAGLVLIVISNLIHNVRKYGKKKKKQIHIKRRGNNGRIRFKRII